MLLNGFALLYQLVGPLCIDTLKYGRAVTGADWLDHFM